MYQKKIKLCYCFRPCTTVTDDDEKKPEINIFYNETKGGVDCLDMLVHNYMLKRQTRRLPIRFFHNLDVVGVAAFIVWTCPHPEWNARKTNKRKLFLKDLGEKLIDAEISRRIQKGGIFEKHPEQMGYFIQQTMADIPHAPNEFVPKRKRCYMCAHSKDRKSRQVCHKCQRNVCGEHSVSTKVCLPCT